MKYFVLIFLSFTLQCHRAGLENIQEEVRRDNEQLGPAPDYYSELNLKSSPPTADVEVRNAGKIVHTVAVDTPVRIQPTILTVDPDDLNKPDTCPVNPGIVREIYDIQLVYTNYKVSLPKQSINRYDCETMGLPYRFNKAGVYIITLTVVSNENEEAKAVTSLTVTDDKQPVSHGFDISAIPLVVREGETVEFTSLGCPEKTGQVDWTFGDGNTAQGTNVAHNYSKAGGYYVAATCKIANFGTLQSSLTLVVVPVSGDVVPGYAPPVPVTTPCQGYVPASPCSCQHLGNPCQTSCINRCNTRCSSRRSCY